MEDERRKLIADMMNLQREDGGWSMESLGPWMPHPDAPVSDGGSHDGDRAALAVARVSALRPGWSGTRLGAALAAADATARVATAVSRPLVLVPHLVISLACKKVEIKQ